jgi:hypothetical protein
VFLFKNDSIIDELELKYLKIQRNLLVLAFLTLLMTFSNKGQGAQNGLKLTFESGALWQHRNDIKRPLATGTLLSFDPYNEGPFIHYRFEAAYQTKSPHGWRLLIAPLSLEVTGNEKRAVTFNGVTFAPNSPLTVNYKFNSYRLGYTYRLFQGSNGNFKLGLTGKIRDAEIKLSQSSLSSSYDNVGFVPLFYYEFTWGFSKSFALFSNADFAYAPQGRAIDITFKLQSKLSKGSTLGLGIRSLEGGADNEKLVSFSFINYLVFDYTLYF